MDKLDVIKIKNFWPKPTQYCKAVILQLKINKFLKVKTFCSGKDSIKRMKRGLFLVAQW